MSKPKRNPVQLERRRRRAITLHAEGLWPAEVARRVGASRQSVSRWLAAHQRGGDAALRATGRLGRKPRLTPAQTPHLEQILTAGADQHGWPTAQWTLRRIVVVVERQFGVRYTPAAAWQVLRRLGWSAQRPVRRAQQRQEGRILGWRRRTWPTVKKNSARPVADSSSSTKAP